MHHPELLLLPILMFADYFLTVLGAIHAEKKHSQHIRSEHYELNPAWQKARSGIRRKINRRCNN